MEVWDLKKFIKIPNLYTDRLRLRKLYYSDFEDVFKYASDTSVTEYLLWSPHPDRGYTKRYLALIEKKYRLGEFYDWGVELNGRIIGTCGFTSFTVEHNIGEIGYVLGKQYWGLGIAAEAARRVIAFGFEELSLNRIESKFMIGNERSLRVLQKCGMKLEGVMKEAVYAKGKYRDVGISSITAKEYYKQK